MTPEAEREFALGWGGTGGELVSALKRGGIDPARGEAAGLLLPSGSGYRDRFRGRVLFPIGDARGRICGFGGRAVDDAVPKYLNSPESEVYRKSSLLYGLYQALPVLRSEGRVLVVEGYMDLIGLWQKGVRGVVATCGTSLTENHARTLKRLSENVILFYDGDVAGKKAAVRSGGPLYAAGVSPKALFPPKGMDPGRLGEDGPPGGVGPAHRGGRSPDGVDRAGGIQEVRSRDHFRKTFVRATDGEISPLGDGPGGTRAVRAAGGADVGASRGHDPPAGRAVLPSGRSGRERPAAEQGFPQRGEPPPAVAGRRPLSRGNGAPGRGRGAPLR